MGSSARRIGFGLFAASAILCFSCEKHHVGELPPEGHNGRNAAITPVPEKNPVAPPTPVEFFPTATPR
jgi:hypothetical protein